MKSAIDSSIIVSALCEGDPDHASCRRLILSARQTVFVHALSETFSTLTGGRIGFRMPAGDAADLLSRLVSPRFTYVNLDGKDILEAFNDAESRGIRGGAIYDYLHLVAARKVGAKHFHTLNLDDFLSFHRPGDPEILPP